MIMKLAGRCAAASFAVALWALPASAQTKKDINDLTQTQQDEMYCVYNTISDGDDYDYVAESYLYTDQGKEDAKKADAAMSKALSTCSSKYGWSQKAKDIASDIGLYGVSVDYLSEDLWFSGVEDKDIDKVFAILDDISDADLDAFYDGSWTKNDALKTRINAKLKAAGLPDEKDTIETGQYMLEASILAADSIFDWIDNIVK